MTNSDLFQRAKAVMPGGVNSPVRAFRAVAATAGGPRFMARGEGARMFDVEGREYLDLLCSWGPLILGHSHPAVRGAIENAVKDGTSFGTCGPLEVGLAERVCHAVPSIEKVRMTSSGTEATMAAVRLARAHTKRPKLVKFDGCYHGHADSLLVAAGSGVATLALPDAMGVPGVLADLTLQAPFNDLAAVDALFKAPTHRDQIAAVILEPVIGNSGLIQPEPGFLAGLRELCTKHGALLIFDEVMTGFRVALGGYQAIAGVAPDLTTLGKVIGGGMPVGAFGGRNDIMSQVAPEGPVYHAGTLSGNPVAMAAGIATLDELARDNGAAYDKLEQLGARLQSGFERACADANVPATVQRQGSMLTLFFTREPNQPVRNFAEAKACDHARFGRYFAAMIERGIYIPPSGYEAWFLSTALTEADADQVIAAHREALDASAA